MRKTLRHILWWTLGAALVLVLLLGAALWWLLGTEPGARWVLARVQSAVGGALQTSEIEGRLLGPLALEGVSYEDSLVRVEATRVVVNWRPSDLLGRRVTVTELAVEDLTVAVKAAPAQTEPKGGKQEKPLPDLDLPVDIEVEALRIQPLTIRQQESPESLLIDRVALDGVTIEDSLGITRLTVQSSLGAVELRGAVLTRGQYPLDLELEWTLHPPGYPDVVGHGRLSGNLEELHIEQEIVEPFDVIAEAEVTDLTRTPSVESDIRIREFQSGALDPELPPVALQGRVTASGQLATLELAGDLEISSDEYGRWDAGFQAQRDGERWQLGNLEARLAGDSLRIEARGVVSPNAEPVRFELDAEWEHLRWPLVGPRMAESPSGTARISGSVEAYEYEADAELTTDGVQDSRWTVSGRGSSRGVEIDPLYGEILGGWIHGTGSIDWESGIRWNLELVGDGMDPGTLRSGLSGDVGFEVRTAGELVDDRPAGELHLVSLDGQVDGLPLRGSGSAVLGSAGTRIADLSIGVADASLTADGEILGPWNLEWALEVPTLSLLHPDYSGSLRGQGSLVGPDSIPRVRFDVLADSVSFGVGRMTAVRADADFDPAPGGDLDLDVAFEEVRFIQGARFDSILVRSRGTTARHNLDVLFYVDADTMQIAFAGAISDTAWTGAIERLRLRGEGIRDWDLVRPAAVALSARHAELRDFCWSAGSSKLCLDALWDRIAGWSFDSTLDGLELDVLDRMFPEEARVETRLDGHARARGGPSGLGFADVKIQSEAGAIHWISRGRDIYLNLDPGELTFAADSQKASGAFRIGFGGGTVEADLLLPNYRVEQRDGGTPIEGHLRFNLPDLTTVQGVTPELGSVRGGCSAALDLGGTTASPKVTGQATLEGGGFEFPRLGLEVTGISLTARSSRDGFWEIDGGMTSGPGRIQVDARADLSGEGGGETSLRLTGERFEALNTLDSRVLVSPDLRMTLSGRRLDIEGEVTIPEAEIVVAGTELSLAVPVSQDVVYADSARVSPPPPIDVHARVRLVLGQSVRFRGFGLRTRMTGSILAIDVPGRPTQGDGELTLNEGTFTGYGRELQIERGKLIFPRGPIDNPEVDVRASRRADDGTIAGVEVRGRLQSMEMTVFSDPERNPEDAISYILYGRPMSDASTQEANVAQQTAALLTMQAGSQLTQKMASSFGLEEARIESKGSMKEASLMLGTHLSPKIYVAYGIGLFEAVNSFRVRYFLNNHWTVQAETGQQTSADLIYSVEK